MKLKQKNLNIGDDDLDHYYSQKAAMTYRGLAHRFRKINRGGFPHLGDGSYQVLPPFEFSIPTMDSRYLQW